MLEIFVMNGFILNLAPLVTGLHRTEHATALRKTFKFLEHRRLHQVRQLIDDKRRERVRRFDRGGSLLLAGADH